MQHILVTGANGQLGSELRRLAGTEPRPDGSSYIFTDIAHDEKGGILKLDITDITALRSFAEKHSIGMMINCAAYTNVEKAEDEPDKANLINHLAAANLATVCKETGAFLIHISTDYVFGSTTGNLPYGEDAVLQPLGIYGQTKLAGEESIKRILENYLIFRTAWLYSEYGNNFVKTMRRLMGEKRSLKVVFDQVGTPTYAGDLAGVIYNIVEKKLYRHKIDRSAGDAYAGYSGIYHFSNEGVCSWYDFAIAIGEMSGVGTTRAKSEKLCHIEPCHSDEFPSKVIRPSFSVLDKTKIKNDFGISIPYWRDSLAACIARL